MYVSKYIQYVPTYTYLQHKYTPVNFIKTALFSAFFLNEKFFQFEHIYLLSYIT